MKKDIFEKQLPTAAWITVAMWLIIQLVLVIIYWDCPQGPDQNGYMRHALENFAIHSTYPSVLNVFDQYLQSPGMVNYLMIQHAVFGTTDFAINKLFNIFLNLGIVINIYYLANRFFNKTTACLSVIIYCIMPTNVFAPIWVLSELPYLFLALTGFSLSLQKKWGLVIFASVLYAISHTFRPLILAFLITSLIYYGIQKRKAIYYILILAPYLCILYGIGTYNKTNTKYFVTSSTTGGFNLIMTANDQAMARPEFSIFGDTTNIAYIPNRQQLSFAEKDSIYKARAIQWIKRHPIKYATLYIEKIGRLWAGDTWSLPKFSNWDDYDYIRTLPNPKKYILIRRAIQAVEGLPYYLVMVLFFITLVQNRCKIISPKGLFLLILSLGTAGTCLFTVEVRFHYPYLFCVVIWTAYGIYMQMERR